MKQSMNAPSNNPPPGAVPVRIGDWVRFPQTPRVWGSVQRVARNQSWCDVRWDDGQRTWTKRVDPARLVVHHTIPQPHLGSWMTVCDGGRKEEIEAILREKGILQEASPIRTKRLPNPSFRPPPPIGDQFLQPFPPNENAILPACGEPGLDDGAL